MTFFAIAGAMILLGIVIYFFINKKSAPKPEPNPNADPWIIREMLPWPNDSGAASRARVAAAAVAVSVTFDKALASLKVGDVVNAIVRINGVLAPVTSVCQWAVDKQGILQIAQSSTTAGLNQIKAMKAGAVRLISIAGGGMSPIYSCTVAAVAPPPPPPNIIGAPAQYWKRARDYITVVSTDFYYNFTAAMYALYAKRYDVVYSGAGDRVAAIKALNPNQHRMPYALLITTLIDLPSGIASSPNLVGWDTYLAANPYEKPGDPSGPTAEGVQMDAPLRGGLILAHQAAQASWNLTAKSEELHSLSDSYEPALSSFSERAAAVVTAGNVQTKYLDDFAAWCKANNISAAAAEAVWLHGPDGKRIIPHIWDSPRNVIDPRDPTARRYTIDRIVRVGSGVNVDGVFLDEFGRGGVQPIYALTGQPTDPIMAALSSLVADVELALAKLSPAKQLVVNTASYRFQFDFDCSYAAYGTHMEQTNNPLSGDLAGAFKQTGNPPNTWSFIDSLLAKSVFVNMVPPYQFGEYESQVGKAGTQHMDTIRGKYLELASYYMVVTDPSLLGLSIENGDWAKYTPVQNWVPAIDADIGRAIETRVKGIGAATHVWMRRFDNGLVLFNPIWNDVWNRSSQDFGPSNQVSVTLPTDRKYFHVDPATGVADTVPTASILLRTPEAAIFICKK